MKKVSCIILFILTLSNIIRAQLLDDDDNLIDPTEFDWLRRTQLEWENEIKDEYRGFYKGKNPESITSSAYSYAQAEGVEAPMRIGNFTYDPLTGELVLEGESEFIDRIEDFVDNLQDDISGMVRDQAINLIYAQLEPLLEMLKEQNKTFLNQILPKGSGMPIADPGMRKAIDKSATDKTFKVWVRSAAEKIFNILFKEEAEGKYAIQREHIELLKNVGVVSFLKMALMDWEVARSFELDVPEAVLDYAKVVRDIYQSTSATLEAGVSLYQEISVLNISRPHPESIEQFNLRDQTATSNKAMLMEMATQRKKTLAITYKQLAARLLEDALDLKNMITQPNQLKMNQAERIQSQKIVNEYLSEYYRLVHKSDQLIQSSYTDRFGNNKVELLKLLKSKEMLDEIHGF